MPVSRGEPSQPTPAPPKVSYFDKVAYIVAPGTVVIGLLYYFGSVYTDAYYAAFGVPAADLQLSVQAYLAKSPKAVFGPLWFLLICGLIVLLVLGRVGHQLARPGQDRRRRTVCRVLLVVGLVMVMLGFRVFFGQTVWMPLPASWWGTRLAPSFLVALGATLAFFSVQQRLLRIADHPRRRREGAAERMWTAGGALLIGLLAMSLFFGVSQYVADAGTTEAVEAIEDGNRESLPVVVYSRFPITHGALGIAYQDMGAVAGPYRHRYTGFLLLVKSPSRYYLVSYTSRGRDYMTVVLPDDETVRVALTSVY
ncbi:hypothetical protein ACIGO8_25780 [Streptomyces sp. NPDC053493]|uniref:hypothetical protein n=1 Tax=Streptomyces sp. NPDC053493 TaxID=3365705 RepID=UPI0037D1DA6D